MKRFFVAMNVCTVLANFYHRDDNAAPIPERSHRAVQACMDYIHRHYNMPLSVPVLAEYVHLNPNYLSTIFKAQTGQTVMEHVARTRVDAAAVLLRKNDLPLSRVAEQTGFQSDSMFFYRFKQFMGMTPQAYRKQQEQLAIRQAAEAAAIDGDFPV